jgi:dTDP-3-amino-3,4,6-trideoxy-alpha-D-glucose transaminase
MSRGLSLESRVEAPPDRAVTPVPVVRLDNSEVWESIHDRLRELVLSGRFVLGPEVEEFEGLAALTFGCSWAVGVSSGTAALVLALRAAPLRPGARVAIPANTFFATFEAVLLAGHVPVVVDHDEHYGISLNDLQCLAVEAVVPVHLYGLPADMTGLRALAEDRGWWVIEDCAQAHGASVGDRPVGSLGAVGAFSAYPTKNVGAWGDAGFVTGDDREVEQRIRALRHHGQTEPNLHCDIASAERLDNLQALVLTEKLRRLPSETASRRRVARWYRERLGGSGIDLGLPSDHGERSHAYHQFVVRVADRERVRRRMADLGVETAVHYPTPVHKQRAARERCEVPRHPARAERWADQILSLPMYPTLTENEADRVAEALLSSLQR